MMKVIRNAYFVTKYLKICMTTLPMQSVLRLPTQLLSSCWHLPSCRVQLWKRNFGELINIFDGYEDLTKNSSAICCSTPCRRSNTLKWDMNEVSQSRLLMHTDYMMKLRPLMKHESGADFHMVMNKGDSVLVSGFSFIGTDEQMQVVQAEADDAMLHHVITVGGDTTQGGIEGYSAIFAQLTAVKTFAPHSETISVISDAGSGFKSMACHLKSRITQWKIFKIRIFISQRDLLSRWLNRIQ